MWVEQVLQAPALVAASADCVNNPIHLFLAGVCNCHVQRGHGRGRDLARAEELELLVGNPIIWLLTMCALELHCIFICQQRFHMYPRSPTPVAGDVSATRVQGSASRLWRWQPTSRRPQEAKSARTRLHAPHSPPFLSPPCSHARHGDPVAMLRGASFESGSMWQHSPSPASQISMTEEGFQA